MRPGPRAPRRPMRPGPRTRLAAVAAAVALATTACGSTAHRADGAPAIN